MLNKELEICLNIIKETNKLVLDIYNSSDLAVEIKEDNSPVTKADKLADKIIVQTLTEHFPLDGFLSEESVDDKSRLNKSRVWIIDPIDGTKEYVAHTGEFTINIGLVLDHIPIFGIISIPVTGEIYYAIKNEGAFYLKDIDSKPQRIFANKKLNGLTALTSRFHNNEYEKDFLLRHHDVISSSKAVGSTIKGCLIASGKAEISYRHSSNTKEWDTCAMQIIVEEAGGHLLKFDKTPIRYNRDDVYNKDGYLIINRIENFLL